MKQLKTQTLGWWDVREGGGLWANWRPRAPDGGSSALANRLHLGVRPNVVRAFFSPKDHTLGVLCETFQFCNSNNQLWELPWWPSGS